MVAPGVQIVTPLSRRHHGDRLYLLPNSWSIWNMATAIYQMSKKIRKDSSVSYIGARSAAQCMGRAIVSGIHLNWVEQQQMHLRRFSAHLRTSCLLVLSRIYCREEIEL